MKNIALDPQQRKKTKIVCRNLHNLLSEMIFKRHWINIYKIIILNIYLYRILHFIHCIYNHSSWESII